MVREREDEQDFEGIEEAREDDVPDQERTSFQSALRRAYGVSDDSIGIIKRNGSPFEPSSVLNPTERNNSAYPPPIPAGEIIRYISELPKHTKHKKRRRK